MIPVERNFLEIKDLKNEFSNIDFVSPSLPIRPLIKKSLGLFTINSTSGIEALITGKKIVVMGNSYYKYNPMVKFWCTYSNLSS